MTRLNRALASMRPPAPVRLVHLGLGNFFRAHVARYTDIAPDADDWGFAAFGGRSGDLARRMSEQGGLYTLVTRGHAADDFDLVGSVSQAYSATDDDAWLQCFRRPELAGVTITVTENGYQAGPAAQRLVAGLAERRRSGGGPVAVVSCDNLSRNGEVTRQVVLAQAQRLDPSLAAWMGENVSFPNTMVDRITPRPDARLRQLVEAATGLLDECAVVTEPFSEWVLSGRFPSGRPAWDLAGATFVDDIEPYERRKLLLLNGAHSLLAYVGLGRGLRTVADAVSDPTCSALLERWWAEAGPEVTLGGEVVQAYCAQLRERWANQRIEHLLGQIAADGSQKLPVRVLPVVRAERAADRMPTAAVSIIGAWIAYLRAYGDAAADVALAQLLPLVGGASREVARRVLSCLDETDPQLADDDDLVEALAAAIA